MLREFSGDLIPPYAILSHCWDENPSNEVSLQDFRKSRNSDSPGMKKINHFCSVAYREHGLRWAWCDTCCIDKKSSAHLSESINSMYRYYAKAKVCLVFLSDVSVSVEDASWQESKWFTRGWTLQEMLAPRAVHFYDVHWRKIGSKDDFADDIAALTGISEYMIRWDNQNPPHFTAGRRLSWAAGRRTTRPEDRAYSLLGLLNIHMPLLYGERERAFVRLQQEILGTTSDESILGWDCEEPAAFAATALGSYHNNVWRADSVLADTPDKFITDPEKLLFREYDPISIKRPRPPAVTSWGIELSTSAKELWPTDDFFTAVERLQGMPVGGPQAASPLLLIPLVVSEATRSYALSCVLILTPTGLANRYGRLCCISERFATLKDATFYAPYFELQDSAKDVTLYLKT